MDPALIIDDDLSDYLARMIDRSDIYAGTNTVGYYIELGALGSNALVGTDSAVVGSEYEEFIDELFKNLDSVLDLEFERCYDENEAIIRIYQADDLDSQSGLGYTLALNGYMQVVYQASDNEEDDHFIITHEIGHSVGLRHPDGEGENDRWDRADTIMSYNYDTNTNFTQTDLDALIGLWGYEQDGSQYSRVRGTGGGDVIDADDAVSYPDSISGLDGADILRGYQGSDTLLGGDGDDEIRGGNGADYLSGGDGADLIYGGFGKNYFAGELDSDLDVIVFKSDQFAYNPVLESTGNNGNLQRVDIIEELDSFDRIVIEGVSTEDIVVEQVSVVLEGELAPTSGYGIYAGAYLEALYVGDNLNSGDLYLMISGDTSYS